jgi:hypothetical protein
MTFLWGRFGKKRESAEYVSDLANIPSKEELLSKLAYLFNYPLTSFACVLSEIAKKLGGGQPEPAAVETQHVASVPEEKKEEVEAKVEAPVPEAPAVETTQGASKPVAETPAA